MRQSLFITKRSWAYYERHCRGKIKPPLTVAKLKEIPTILEVYDCNDSRSIPPGILMIFVDGPELNDFILDFLPVGVCAEIITWSFDPKFVNEN